MFSPIFGSNSGALGPSIGHTSYSEKVLPPWSMLVKENLSNLRKTSPDLRESTIRLPRELLWETILLKPSDILFKSIEDVSSHYIRPVRWLTKRERGSRLSSKLSLKPKSSAS